VIQQVHRVLYRETHTLLDDLAEATLDGTRKEHMELLVTVPLLIIDDLGMRKLPLMWPKNCSRSSCAATNVSVPG
jgi:DNA replication protein DnaC